MPRAACRDPIYYRRRYPAEVIELCVRWPHRRRSPGCGPGFIRKSVSSNSVGMPICANRANAAWNQLYEINPSLVGGCRPLHVRSQLDDRDWSVEHSEVTTSWGIASEIVVVRRLSRAKSVSDGSDDQVLHRLLWLWRLGARYRRAPGAGKCQRHVMPLSDVPAQCGVSPNILLMTSSAFASKHRPWLRRIRRGCHEWTFSNAAFALRG